MDGQIRVRKLSTEEAEALREEYRRATAPWTGSTFKHFATPEDEARHLEQVKQAQKDGAPF